MRTVHLVIALAALGLCQACGIKGPLAHPQRPQAPAPAAVPAPADPAAPTQPPSLHPD